MINIINVEDCVGCNSCVQKCPVQCITMSQVIDGFKYPVADSDKCIECGLCEKVCPVINQKEAQKPLHIYATWNTDNNIRLNSSSGGAFYVLAKYIIENGGVVFGARFDKNWKVIHDYTDNLNELSPFLGSKYMQSVIDKTYIHAEKFLKEGKNVLFSGTPCQIAGLKLFLNKEYDNLFCIDFACHGVPSPSVWKWHLKDNILNPGYTLKDIGDISFRDKQYGWINYGISLRSSCKNVSTSNQIYYSSFREDTYMQLFLKNLSLRPSCFKCPSKCWKSHSDITLGDCWGINNIIKDIDITSGVSLITLNTPKGAYVFNSLFSIQIPLDYQKITAFNPALIESSRQPKHYKLFWKTFQSNKYNEIKHIIVKSHPSLFQRQLSRAKTICKKILNLIR